MLKTRFIARRAVLTAAAAAVGLMASPLLAQTFPTKPVRIISSFPAGSGPDAGLRVVADQLSKKWKQAVVIDNRPGGNGFIAIGALKQAAPDGYELLQLDMAHVVTHPYTFSKLPYDPRSDLALVRPLFQNEFFIAVSAGSAYKSVDDIVAAARAKPGQLTYGSWFNGSPGHLGALRLEAATGVKMLHVPFREMSQLYSNVATGEVQWALGSAASAGALEKAGKLRFLATSGIKRSAVYPNLPTANQATGASAFSLMSWTGLAAPKGTPKALREKISADVLEVLRSPEVQERFRGMGYDLLDLAPDAFAQYIESERDVWSKIIADANLKLD